MASLLAQYLRQANRPFDWRKWNCGHFVCGWLKHAYDIDLPLGNRDWIKVWQTNELEPTIDRVLLPIGFIRKTAHDMISGDIVLIEPNCAMGIAALPLVAMIERRGVLYMQPTIRAAWGR